MSALVAFGAALLEVKVRLLKALIRLAEINPAIFKDACDRHVDLLVTHAETTLAKQHEKDQLSSLARTITRKAIELDSLAWLQSLHSRESLAPIADTTQGPFLN